MARGYNAPILDAIHHFPKELATQLKRPQDWNTREDVFANLWSEAVGFLENNNGVEAKALFEYIQSQHKGRFKANWLRTFQRMVQHWKALYGPSLEVYFPQDYEPGQFAASYSTNMNDIGITINWILFEHC